MRSHAFKVKFERVLLKRDITGYQFAANSDESRQSNPKETESIVDENKLPRVFTVPSHQLGSFQMFDLFVTRTK